IEVLLEIAFDGTRKRRYRRDRVHDLVGKHPHQVLPGFHFLFFKLTLDILKRDQFDVLTLERELYCIYRKLNNVVVELESEQFTASCLESSDHIDQRHTDFFEIIDRVDAVGAEEAAGGTVEDFNLAVFLYDNKSDAYMHHDVSEEKEFGVTLLPGISHPRQDLVKVVAQALHFRIRACRAE